MIYNGTVVSGNGLAAALGFATINVILDESIEPGLYKIKNETFGEGVLIMLSEYGEIHFIRDCHHSGESISFELKEDILKDIPPCPGTLIGIIMEGIENEKQVYLEKKTGS